MYLSRCNWQLGVAVWWVAGFQTDEDWEQEFADMRDLMAQSPTMPFRPAVLLYLNCNRPNATRRKQVAEMSALPAYNPYLACVTTDPELKGAQVAMNWAGPPAACEKVVFETIDAGLVWLEERRGTPLVALRILTDSVKQLAAQRLSEQKLIAPPRLSEKKIIATPRHSEKKIIAPVGRKG